MRGIASLASGYDAQAAMLAPVQAKVGRAVQRSPGETVGYNSAGGRDPEQRDGALPFLPGGGWNHAEILSNLSQVDDDPMTEVDGFRCSAVSFLGMQIASGPARVIAVAAETERRLAAAVATWVPDLLGLRERLSSARVNYMRAMQPLLGPIIGRLGARTATYQDLRRLSSAIYAVSDTNEDAHGLDGSERAGLSALTPDADRVVSEIRNGWDAARELFAELAADPTQAALVGVSLRGREGALDHNITIGFDSAVYVFDPLARGGTQLMRLGSHDVEIRSYFEEDGGGLNWCLERFVPPARAPGGRSPPRARSAPG